MSHGSGEPHCSPPDEYQPLRARANLALFTRVLLYEKVPEAIASDSRVPDISAEKWFYTSSRGSVCMSVGGGAVESGNIGDHERMFEHV